APPAQPAPAPPPEPPPAPPGAAEPDFDFGPAPSPIKLGPLKSESSATGSLDLSGIRASTATDIELTTDFDRSRASLEIEVDGQWRPLGDEPVRLTLRPGGPRNYRVQIITSKCPAACAPDEPHQIAIEARRLDGSTLRTAAPLSVGIEPDPW